MIYNNKYNKMEEIYKVIKGYENYSVSNLGNVKNNTTNKILKHGVMKNGYHNVSLTINPFDKKSLYVHRLVGLAFLENNENKSDIDHIDQNRGNNNLLNLRWATRSQNNYNTGMRITNTSGTKGVSFNKSKNKWEAYIQIDMMKVDLGCFVDKQDAINARVQKANEVFGIYTNKCEKTN